MGPELLSYRITISSFIEIMHISGNSQQIGKQNMQYV